jgi:pyrroloquinoline-quinone synthase
MHLSDRSPRETSAVAPRLDVEEVAAQPSLASAVALVESRYDFRAHPYLLWMDEPSTQVASFRVSQVPFRFAVESFSQALAAVLARTPRLELRLPLVDNIHEEHGRGDLWASHKVTFGQYLRALSASPKEVSAPCPVAVRAFNQSLLDFCLTQPHEPGAALLGMIEHLYVGVSRAIARTIHDRSWCAPGSQSHYAIHEQLDVAHARDLLDLAQPAWREPRARQSVSLGLALGAHWFWALYRDLLPTEECR